jgi:hypothetical protein
VLPVGVSITAWREVADGAGLGLLEQGGAGRSWTLGERAPAGMEQGGAVCLVRAEGSHRAWCEQRASRDALAPGSVRAEGGCRQRASRGEPPS